jgi:hypothetical protein
MHRLSILLAAALLTAACGEEPPQGRRASRQTFGTGSGPGGTQFGTGSGPGGTQFGTGSGPGGTQFGTGSGPGGAEFGTGSGTGGVQFGTGGGGEGGTLPGDGGTLQRPATCEAACTFLVQCGGNFSVEQCVAGCQQLGEAAAPLVLCVAAAQTCEQAAACVPAS